MATTIRLLVLLAFIVASYALTLQVEPKTEECFYERFDKGDEVEVQYSVIRGGLLDINVIISDPQNNIIFQTLHFEKQMEGKRSFAATIPGIYKVCFNNEMSRFTAKVVSFAIKSVSVNEKPVSPEDLSPMESSIAKIASGLELIQVEQKQYRIREREHRDMQEATCSRVVWWAIGESAVLLGMSVWQLYYLRKWFEVKPGKI